MSVIINDFEIVTDTRTTDKGASSDVSDATGDDGSDGQQPLSPRDIRHILRHQAQRLLRVRAH